MAKTKGKSEARRVPRKKPAKKKQHKHLSWDNVELEALNPLLQRQFVVGENVMVARIHLKKGAVVPLHAHFHEQISNMLQGTLRFVVDGKEIILGAGDVLTIPPHMPHSAEALEDSLALDIFNPPRMDWINGTDRYLREAASKPAKSARRVG